MSGLFADQSSFNTFLIDSVLFFACCFSVCLLVYFLLDVTFRSYKKHCRNDCCCFKTESVQIRQIFQHEDQKKLTAADYVKELSNND